MHFHLHFRFHDAHAFMVRTRSRNNYCHMIYIKWHNDLTLNHHSHKTLDQRYSYFKYINIIAFDIRCESSYKLYSRIRTSFIVFIYRLSLIFQPLFTHPDTLFTISITFVITSIVWNNMLSENSRRRGVCAAQQIVPKQNCAKSPRNPACKGRYRILCSRCKIFNNVTTFVDASLYISTRKSGLSRVWTLFRYIILVITKNTPCSLKSPVI